jgi:hypothetical protein
LKPKNLRNLLDGLIEKSQKSLEKNRFNCGKRINITMLFMYVKLSTKDSGLSGIL